MNFKYTEVILNELQDLFNNLKNDIRCQNPLLIDYLLNLYKNDINTYLNTIIYELKEELNHENRKTKF